MDPAEFEGTGDTVGLLAAVQAARDAVRAGASDGAGQSVLRGRLADLLFSLYQHTGDTRLLDEAIRETRAGIDESGDAPVLAVHFNNLGGYLYELFLVTEDLPALREAEQAIRRVLALVTAERPERPMLLDNHWRVLVALFNQTGDTATLAEAVAAAHEKVMTELIGAPGRATGLAAGLAAVLGRPGDGTALAEMIKLADGPVGSDDDDGDDVAAYLSQTLYLADVAIAATRWADESNDTALLQQSLEASRDAVTATPAGHPHRRLALGAVCLAASFLGVQTGDLGLFAEWVQAERERLVAAEDDADRAEALDSLGGALRKLAQRTGDIGMFEEAVRTSRGAVDLAAPSDPERNRYSANLREALSTLAERTGEAAVFEEAVRVARETAARAGPGDPDRAEYLASLSASLRQLSGRTVDPAALLAEAVQSAREAAAAAPGDDPFRGQYLDQLGIALLASYERSGHDSDLAESVRSHRAAVAATSEGNIDRPSYLSNLGFALRLLLERTGDAEILSEMVQVAEHAVAATLPGHPSLPARLTNLCAALQVRYERAAEIAVLRQAVEAARRAAAATPPGHTEHSGYQSNLANVLRLLFQRTGEEQVLAEAEQAAREAAATAGRPDDDRITSLANLGVVLRVRFDHTGDVAALAEAVRVTAGAADAAGPGSPKRALCLSNLADGLRILFEETQDPALLAEAASAAEEAVSATPAGQPARTAYLMNLAYVLAAQAGDTGDQAVMTRARNCLAEAAGNTTASVPDRIRAYREAAELTAVAGGTPGEALDQVEAAVALLPLAAARTLAREDQEHAVARLASLPGQVAAAAVAAGRPDRAVELLEQTRGILVADTLDALSSDVRRLRSASPALAAEFARLRGQVDALSRGDGLGGSADSARLRQGTYAAWDDLVARIRAVNGFEDFLRAPDIHVLARQAAAGPVIFPYASETGCGAVILTGNPGAPATAVAFNATEQDVFRQAAKLADALEAGNQDVIQAVLAWLWDFVTGPVLTALGRTGSPHDQPWLRVWWCPTGVFAYLPLHAAGYHDDSPRSALDLVVSSYATTLRGMAYARGLRSAATSRRTLVVVASDVPGTPRLPGASRESQILAKFIPTAATLWRPTRNAVMAALPAAQVAHFACHGCADNANPRASQLVLYDYDTSPLTVADIGSLRLASELAYLSACDSAVTSLGLADEAVHLAGAFHLAGYQNVVGTLWPVGDRTAGMIAEDFYRQLTRGGTAPPDTSLTSFALHSATRRLRDRFPGHPGHWAGYIHTGN